MAADASALGDTLATATTAVVTMAATGDVLAIVGPSGAGKTILLNTLTLEKGPGAESGTVALNGHTITQALSMEK